MSVLMCTKHPMGHCLECADENFAALVAERDALRADALRYRWLHNARRMDIVAWADCETNQAADALIDAALAKGA